MNKSLCNEDFLDHVGGHLDIAQALAKEAKQARGLGPEQPVQPGAFTGIDCVRPGGAVGEQRICFVLAAASAVPLTWEAAQVFRSHHPSH